MAACAGTVLAVSDAACATMLTPYLDAGPFTRSEFDELLAPWRAVVENCPRSRLAVQIMTGWIGPASALWATADAVLAERSASD